MNSNDILTLNINSNAFEAMKADFDKVLRRTLGNMQVKESKDATLTVKLNINLTEVEVPDFESAYPNAMRKINKPRFDHKVSSVMQIKSEESGSLKGEYELVWDEDKQDFVMKPIDNGQRSLFDDNSYDDYYEDEDQKALPAPKPMLEALDGNGDVEGGYPYEEDNDE